jgi:hypothetical protein
LNGLSLSSIRLLILAEGLPAFPDDRVTTGEPFQRDLVPISIA